MTSPDATARGRAATGDVVVRVRLPEHLRRLARVDGEVPVTVPTPVTMDGVLDALEAAHPALAGTVRDRASGKRRSFVRFFVAEEDRSHAPTDTPLPVGVATGEVPVIIVGAMAGG